MLGRRTGKVREKPCLCACVFKQVIERGRMVEVMVNFCILAHRLLTYAHTHMHTHNGRLSIHELCLFIVLPIMHLFTQGNECQNC